MLSLEEIQEWWQRKINNYLENCTSRNQLSLVETIAITQFFIKPHENFIIGPSITKKKQNKKQKDRNHQSTI